MKRIHLATGLARLEDRVLLVASTYPSHPQPLWNLPGGRTRDGELLEETVVREVREETGLVAQVISLAYVSESYDGELHVLNVTFDITVSGTLRIPERGDHVVDAQWVAIPALDDRLTVDVIRLPLQRYLRSGERYAGFPTAGIHIIFLEDA